MEEVVNLEKAKRDFVSSFSILLDSMEFIEHCLLEEHYKEALDTTQDVIYTLRQVRDSIRDMEL